MFLNAHFVAVELLFSNVEPLTFVCIFFQEIRDFFCELRQFISSYKHCIRGLRRKWELL